MQRITIRNLTRRRPLTEKTIRGLVKRVLKLEGVSGYGLSITLVSDARIKRLNRRYFKKNRSTDVIAFSAQEGKYIAGTDKFLGDIAISLDAAERQAQIFKSTPKEELKLYLVHGVLHLLGYDDLTKAGFKMIAKRQAELLKRAG